MKIIKLDSRRPNNDRKATTDSKELSYFVDSFHKIQDAKMNDIVVTVSSDQQRKCFMIAHAKNPIFTYVYFLIDMQQCLILGNNIKIEKLISWAKKHVDEFKNAKQIYVMRLERKNDVGSLNRKPAPKNIKKSNKPHLIKRGLHDGDN